MNGEKCEMEKSGLCLERRLVKGCGLRKGVEGRVRCRV